MRGAALASMPRTGGVSSSVGVRPMRLRPRPTSVARWSFLRRMGLPVWRTVTLDIVFLLSFGFAGGVGATADDVADLLAALGRDLAGRSLDLQGFEGGAHHVVGVGRADRLADHILHAQRLEHRPHGAAGDHAGAGRRRADHDLARAPAAGAVMVQGATLAQGYADHRLLGFLGRLADGLGNFAGLAVAEADAAFLVADDHQGGERESPATFHRRRDAVDVHQLLDDVAVGAVFGVAVAPVAPVTSL